MSGNASCVTVSLTRRKCGPAGSARVGRNKRADWLGRSRRRHGENRKRFACRQGVHRSRVRHRHGAWGRWRGESSNRCRRCGGAAGRRARVRARDPAAAYRSRTHSSKRKLSRGTWWSSSTSMAEPTPQTDRDLASIAEARALARRAKQAWLELAEFSQERIDTIVDAMAAAATHQAYAFARITVDETGYCVVDDKIHKNLFASQKVYSFIRPMKTVGIIARLDDRRVIEIAEPFGVVAAVVPSTNPTSTAIYKILISLKARCSVVLSPHPAAVKCITRGAEVVDEAARRAGPPVGASS